VAPIRTPGKEGQALLVSGVAAGITKKALPSLL
jgi:hypothetical protein